MIDENKIDFSSILKSLLLSHSSLKYEIEARVGKIYNKEVESRIKLSSLVPVIFTKLPNNHSFIPGVDQWDFKSLKKGLQFKESIEDYFKYLRNGNRIRYVNKEYRFVEKKTKVLVLDIYLPDYKYDIRISIMTEEKQMQRHTQSPVEFIRYRQRDTFTDKWFNYDFTTVTKNKEITYELEIEVENMNYKIEDFLLCFFKMNIKL